MTEKRKKISIGEVICMGFCACFLIVLLRAMGFSGIIVGAVGGGGGALAGMGIYQLLILVKNKLVSSENL